MVKHTQTIRWLTASELFEFVSPFCGIEGIDRWHDLKVFEYLGRLRSRLVYLHDLQLVFQMHWIFYAFAAMKLCIVFCNYFQHSPTSCLNETLFSMKIKNIDRTILKQNDNTVTKVLLFGNFKNADAANTLICYATINYMLAIKWLPPYLLIYITNTINQL